MAQFVLLLMLGLYPFGLYAEDLDDFSYFKNDKTLTYQEKLSLTNSISQNFPSETFFLPQPFFMDTLHASRNNQQAVMTKFGYDPNRPDFYKKVLAFEKGFLYHSRTTSGKPYALYFEGFTKDQVREFLGSIHLYSSTSVKPKTVATTLMNFILPSAHASSDDDCNNEKGFIPDWLRHTGVQAASCLTGVFQGAWDSTGGVVSGLANAVTHPIESGKAIWKGASKFWAGLKAFKDDFRASLKKVVANYDSMPEGSFTELECRIASALGTGVLVSYFTFGAGAPGVALKIAQLLKTFGISSKLSIIANTSASLAKSKSVIFFKKDRAVKMSSTTLTPGKSYTVLLHKDSLVIGEDIVGIGLGNARTHITLRKMLGVDERQLTNYRGKGGAILVRSDGTIDVSGYHLQRESPMAASAIAEKLKSIAPNLEIRQTGGRLSDLKD